MLSARGTDERGMILMGSHGKAREATITALESRKPFKRSGFGMWAVEGAASGTGRMPEKAAAEYKIDDVAYTVLSYATPIAWVTTDGIVKIPSESYSSTTNQHQHLCRIALGRDGYVNL